MHRRLTPFLAAWAVALLGAPAATAAVHVNPLIGEGMVLQQSAKVPLWGTADPGEKVVVRFQGREAETTAKDGAWTVWLADLKPGGPFELTIRGDDVVRVKEVWVGEVWLCAGQMNMDFPLRFTAAGPKAVEEARNPDLHFFQVRYAEAVAPLKEVKGAWTDCTPETAAGFSATAYAFGRDLQRRHGVPVGLIQATVCASSGEGWIGRPDLEANKTLKEIVQHFDEEEKKYSERVRRYLDEYREKVNKALAEGQEAPAGKPPDDPLKDLQRPGGLYNGMIAPLQPYALRGVVWQQGESDVGHADRCQALLTAAIGGWRAAWKQGDFPFLFAQLGPFGERGTKQEGSALAEVREAQRLVSRSVANTAMIVTTDAGDARDARPPVKDVVGARFALAARALAYGEKTAYTGPVYDSFTVEKEFILLRFKGSLAPQEAPLGGFSIAGEDHVFVPAHAEFQGDEVVVHSRRVANPKAVRYGWADRPAGDLTDKTGLPASPFRTDDFPLGAPPPATAAVLALTRPVPAGAIKVRLPEVQQRDNYSCGAAALMGVCSGFGVGPDDLEEFKKALGTDEIDGTNVHCIRRMAEALGLDAAIRHDMTLDDLRKHLDAREPVICSIQAYGDADTYYRDDNGHYVVAIGYDEENFYFADPVLPGRRGFLPAKEFDRRWHDDEGTTDKPEPHQHLGVVIHRKPGDPAPPRQARKID